MITTCECCGVDFTTYPSHIRRGRGKFCSKECMYFTTPDQLLERIASLCQTVETGCILWMGSAPTGYPQIGFNGKHYRGHRLVYEIINGKFDDNLCVLHSCDVPLCLNPDHLFLGTMADNSVDMVNKGRSAAGMKNANSVLTNLQVLWIRSSKSAGVPSRKIAAALNINLSTVKRIVARKTWKHL